MLNNSNIRYTTFKGIVPLIQITANFEPLRHGNQQKLSSKT